MVMRQAAASAAGNAAASDNDPTPKIAACVARRLSKAGSDMFLEELRCSEVLSAKLLTDSVGSPLVFKPFTNA